MNNEYVIIGIDPGLMTGVYAYCSAFGSGEPNQIPADKVPARLDSFLGLWVPEVGASNIHIAVEKYIITAKTAKLSQQVDALEVTGMVKAVAALHGVYHVEQFMKANLKFASDEVLQEAGWWSMEMRHANDAARQTFALLKDVDYPTWSELFD